MLSGSPTVVAVVPTLGADLDRLNTCLQAALASEFDGRLTVVVVWNDPRRPLPALSDVTVLQPGLNLGFPAALNHARSRVEADFLWVLQDDVVPAPDCLRALLKRMNGLDQLAVISPVALTAEGLVQAQTRGGVLAADGSMDHWFPEADTPPDDMDLDHRLDYVASSGTLARLSVWDEVGGFDPEFYPLLWSDVDFCHRVRAAGYGIALEPTAVITHQRNSSTTGLLGEFLHLANQGRFTAKHVHRTATPTALDVDVQLLQKVGFAASLVLIDFAAHAASRHRSALDQAAQLEAQRVAQIAALEHQMRELGTVIASRERLVAARNERISRLLRRLAARDQRIHTLRGRLSAMESSRSWQAGQRARSAQKRIARMWGH